MQGEVTAGTTYTTENGATVSIKPGYALDYSLMCAAQLNALLNVIRSPGFAQSTQADRDDCIFLASRLAQEIPHLFRIVAAEAAIQ